ncbi:DUF922 domain-containing protein [Marilutibacter spongiae]|uniref:DUF922 domain-containing protein n=1 Tax=Marilutibacter spongiae TaxID=2025720 RepID=A0A7W3Y5N0_9GAMM|nr:DUF922 domain-containing protein [Lysobacter spongiae]MBB1060091.1 DUF922 domain-containing protein [Lysobacter spongiae]
MRRRGRALRLLGAVGVGFLAAPVSADAGVDVDDSVEHYVVTGDDARQWQAAMQAHGPRDPVSGLTYSGFTRWHVTWSWDTYPLADGDCQLGGHRVHVEVVVRLPEWSGRTAASGPLRREWDALYARLRAHEALHRDNALAAARALDAMLAGMDAPIPCAGARKRIDREARDLLARFREEDRRLDRETRHGRVEP